MVNVLSKIIDRSNYLKIVDAVHDKVHEGNFYTLPRSTTLVASSTLFIVFEVPNSTITPHFQFAFNAAAAASIALYEAPTVASTFAAVTPTNNNRKSTNAATLTVRVSVPSSDVTSTGTLLESAQVGGGTNPVSVIGGATGSRNEWLLNQNTKYLIMINSASTNTISYNATWYEV